MSYVRGWSGQGPLLPERELWQTGLEGIQGGGRFVVAYNAAGLAGSGAGLVKES